MHKKWPKNFQTNLGQFEEYSFAPPKHSLLLHLCRERSRWQGPRADPDNKVGGTPAIFGNQVS